MIAVDLGLKHTGWCDGTANGVIEYKPPSAAKKTDPETARQVRLAWWRRALRDLFNGYSLIVIESPFISAKHPAGAIATFELHGIARVVAWDMSASLKYVDNMQLKSWVRTHAQLDGLMLPWPMSKHDMMAAAAHWGCTYTTDDDADAFLLHRMMNS